MRFCEVQVPSPHPTPATDSCKTLAGSFSASQYTAGQYSLHFFSKKSGVSWELNLYVTQEERQGAALPALRAATFHLQPPCLCRAGWKGNYLCSCQNVKLGKEPFPSAPESQWTADLSQLSGDFFISQGTVFPGVISNQSVS